MPALNTPQFDWARNRTGRRPQPVPPIFQPEVAARAVLLAVDRRRREVWAGGSTVKAILATKLAPGLLDRLLARTGYTAQMSEEPADPAAPDNLFQPVPGDHGAHGRFDRRATASSLQLWATAHRQALAIGGGIALGLAGAALARAGRRRA